MSATLSERLDPVSHLPERVSVGVSEPAYRFARGVLNEMYPSVDYQHAARSSLAGAALYVATVVVAGDQDSVRQCDVADACGTTPMSVRAHTSSVAEIALTVDLADHPDVDRERLREIAETGRVRIQSH